MKTLHPRKQAGSSLVVVIAVLATLMVIVGVAAEYTSTVNRHVLRSNTQQSAVSAADSCIDILFSNWRKICSTPGSVTVPQNTSQFAAIPLPTNSQLNLPSATNFAKRGTSFDPGNDEYDSTFTISNYKVVAVNAEWQALASASATPEPLLGQINAALSSILPTTPLVYNYVASADVTLPALGPTGKVVARVRRVFQKQQLSPWNFAIFYVDPLEIHPGPAFTVTGWVHTNSDLYTGHDTLTFADKVTYGSDWFVDFKPGETYHNADTPAAPHYPGNLPPARDQAMQPFGLDATSIFSTSDANPNNDSYHELIEQPVAGYTDPLSGQRYYDQAAIKILIDGSNNVTVKKFDGTTVTSSSTGNDLKLYTAVSNALTTNQTIQDNREAASVRLATLDIGSLVTSLSNSSTSSSYISSSRWNGIVYISDTSYSSTTRRGIRLKNGKVLPSSAASSQITVDGLTVASSNPVYIQGDYNTGNGTVPSNSTTSNDPTTPQASGYTRQPASVVADAVTVLSNNWNDANAAAGKPLSGRVATNTTVNTAIIAGIVASSAVGGDGNYSGGAENFPRFLEGWDNIKFTYYGSMLELYQSKQAIGEWTMTNVYDAPDRQWYFDTNFKIKPPPGSLMLYSYIKGKWSVL
jgi:hypothetical protein